MTWTVSRLIEACRPISKLAILLACGASCAQNATVYTEQGQLVRASQNVTALGPDLMGDKVNLYTGAVEFSQTDVSLPGNNALPVSVGRRYVAGIQRLNKYDGLFADWDLEIPHLHGIYAAGTSLQGWVVWASPATSPSRLLRCSKFNPPPDAATPAHAVLEPDEFWGGHFLYVPGGSGDEKLLKRDAANTARPADGYDYPIVTKSQWQFRCISGLASPTTVNGTEPSGEGFVARSPDGTQYVFNWMASRPYRGIGNSTGSIGRQEVWILPTRVTDRFGNTVTYTYDTADPWKLLSIVSSDGRSITLGYGSGHRVAAVNDGTRNWTYGYDASRLTGATLPDGSAWGFSLDEQTFSPHVTPANRCEGGTYSDGTLEPRTQTNTITHPSGAVGSFVMSFVMHGRSGKSSSPGNPCQGSGYWSPDWPTPAYGVRSLVGKTISGPGLGALTWSYGWGPPNGSLYCTGSCPVTKTLTVADPQGFQTRYTFGNRYQATEGQLLQVDEGWDGNNALRTTLNSYRAAGAGPYPESPGYSGSDTGDDWMETRNLPLAQRTIYQQAASFTWQATSFDTLARVTAASRSSSLGYGKAEATAYADNAALWVLGQVASRTVAGITTVATSYDGNTALPSATYRFGKLQASYAFNADGTLASTTDGLNQSTRFSNYKRGLAQRIDYADGSFMTGVVDNLGLLASVTNEAGTTWRYGYDAMGRLASKTPPGGDAVAYNPTTLAFVQVPGAEVGLDGGHWRQTITTGNAVTVNHFDALWRKRLTTTYDAGNPAATQRSERLDYDPDGRPTFVAYPARSIGSIYAAAAGTATAYDALGRTTQTRADSELGTLTTSMQYFGGFQQQLTNPRGYTSTSSYQVFDNPSAASLTGVAAPEGVNLAISRDIFGKPLAITRGGASAGSGPSSVTRSYVYDAYQRLCKTVEPESGATIQDYDAAGNVAWRASGLALSATNSCDTASVGSTSKAAFTYDARNRLTGTGFGDGSPSIGRAYTTDGLPLTIVSDGSTWTYGYNNRRLLTSEFLAFRSGGGWNIGHGYDANGHDSQIVYPDGAALAYNPNALGEPTTVGGYASAVSFHPNGAVAGYTLANGIVHSLSQNARGLPLVNRDAGVMQDQYAFDANGNVGSIADQQEGVFSRSMGYDGLDRLTAANAPNVWGTAGYGYDALDNLRTSVVGGRSISHGYDAANRLDSLSVNGAVIGYAYDSRGNVTGKGGQGFYFDMANRMVLANGAARYFYDGLGRRTNTSKADGTYLSLYSRDGQLLFGSSPAYWTRYVYLGGKQIAESTSAGVTTYVHTDALGSPVAKTNAAGAVISRTRYEPYGYAAAGTNPTGPGFTGHVNDTDTGLVYMQQRYYDPIAGMFLSVDPVATDGNVGSAFNRFSYGENNPYRFTDPDGQQSVGEFIDRRAMDSAIAGEGLKTYGWAFAGTAWKAFGAEGISKIADKGLGGASTGDKIGAGFELAGAALGPIGKLGGAAKGIAAETRFINGVAVTDRATGNVLRGTVDLTPTLDRIAAGKNFPHRNDGAVFGNKEGLLPQQPGGYYREYVHPTPGVSGAGPQRIVTGRGGEVFYTPDHYGTFIPVRP